MNLKKVSSINFEKKDCDPTECPNCEQNNWRVSTVTEKVTQVQHIHLTCIFCDLTYCPEVVKEMERAR
jgi:hypothetical protein